MLGISAYPGEFERLSMLVTFYSENHQCQNSEIS